MKSTKIRVSILIALEVNCYGKGQGVRSSSLGPESEPIEKSEHVSISGIVS